MFSDIQVIYDNDPAAKNIFDVLTYQGLWAILLHRWARLFYRGHIPILPRLISVLSRLLTGIEIHPGAKIGKRFFIDHGAGVMIGETSEIGDNVTIFQGVTLGGTGKEKGKRHPSIGNNVVIGAGAIVLGAIHVGANARIGAGSVVTKSIPPDTTVVGNPSWVVRQQGRRLGPLEHGGLPDPVHKAFSELSDRVKALEEKLK